MIRILVKTFIAAMLLISFSLMLFGTPDEIKPFLDGQGLIVATLLYALLLSVPFLPAFEIGFCTMCLFGNSGVLLIYLSTVFILCGCFLFGRSLNELTILPPDKQKKVKDWLLKSKYGEALALSTLLNIPGNSIFGGGAGIAIFFGNQSSMSFLRYTITVLLGTLPLPLIFWLTSFY